MLYPFSEIANFKCTKERAVKENAHACRISTPPTRGAEIFGKAWEWTVYLVQGVWRCLREDKLNIVLRFLY